MDSLDVEYAATKHSAEEAAQKADILNALIERLTLELRKAEIQQRSCAEWRLVRFTQILQLAKSEYSIYARHTAFQDKIDSEL